MYPQLPDQDTLRGLSAAELRTLASEFREACRKAAETNPSMSAEEFAEWENAKRTIATLTSLGDFAEADEEAEKQAAADEAAAEQAAADAKAAEEAAAKDDGDNDVDDDDPDASAKDGEVDSDASVVPTGLSLPGTPTIQTPTGTGWLSTGIGGTERGTEFASMAELGEIVQDVMAAMADGDNTKTTIARMPSAMPEDRILDQSRLFTDLAELTSGDDEIQAAFCPPLTPLYDLSCANVTRRPVFGGLPQYQPDANRGGFRVPESPSLFDITGGFGQWTSVNDADLEAIKAACQTISCVNWNDFEWYGTYRCLKVRNMMQMTFPELVAAYLNRLQARWARYAEVLLLEQMGTASTSVDGIPQAYGANVSLHRNILNYLGKYADIERWDTPQMDAWMPRWLLWALRMDMVSRRRDGGYVNASEETVNAAFRDVGVEPHWYMDRPSWATPSAPLSVNGTLTQFPSSVEILLHRRGKFAVMDKGELTVGLGGNPIRIEDDLRRNQATFFFESFEGLIDTDSCPAHLLTVEGLCYNGRQIADAQIECEGYDLVGVGSG